MKGAVLGFDPLVSEQIYLKLRGNRQVLTWVDVLLSVDSDNHPEVLDGLREYAQCYVNDVQNVLKEEIMELFKDMHAADPEKYTQAVQTLWRI